MPQAKRERRERTGNWTLIRDWCRSPGQRLYEGIYLIIRGSDYNSKNSKSSASWKRPRG
ncbi:MAG: hypothetical protein ACRDHE_00735 [Ktedonobacterales bacterium]